MITVVDILMSVAHKDSGFRSLIIVVFVSPHSAERNSPDHSFYCVVQGRAICTYHVWVGPDDDALNTIYSYVLLFRRADEDGVLLRVYAHRVFHSGLLGEIGCHVYGGDYVN